MPDRFHQGPPLAAAMKGVPPAQTTHGKNKRNLEVFNGPEFIATVVRHIPPPGFQLVGSRLRRIRVEPKTELRGRILR